MPDDDAEFKDLFRQLCRLMLKGADRTQLEQFLHGLTTEAMKSLAAIQLRVMTDMVGIGAGKHFSAEEWDRVRQLQDWARKHYADKGLDWDAPETSILTEKDGATLEMIDAELEACIVIDELEPIRESRKS